MSQLPRGPGQVFLGVVGAGEGFSSTVAMRGYLVAGMNNERFVTMFILADIDA
jgi:hypothetical protein